MQRAGARDLLQLPPQPHQLIVDRTPVGLDLRLAGATHESQPAALPLKVRPGPHQPRALIAERRHFHLQHPLAGGGAIAEDLQDQPGPVQKLDPPGLFQIALLHRAHGAIDQHQLDLGGRDGRAQFFQLALAKETPCIGLAQPHHARPDNLKIRKRQRQRHRLLKRQFRCARPRRAGDLGMNDPGPSDRARRFAQGASSPS